MTDFLTKSTYQPRIRQKAWTLDEIEYVHKHYKYDSDPSIGKAIHRTASAIKSYRFNYGLIKADINVGVGKIGLKSAISSNDHLLTCRMRLYRHMVQVEQLILNDPIGTKHKTQLYRYMDVLRQFIAKLDKVPVMLCIREKVKAHGFRDGNGY